MKKNKVVKKEKDPILNIRDIASYKAYLTAFLLPLILLIFSYYKLGFYFETNDDPRYVMAMKGFAFPTPYDNFPTVYKFTIYLYIFLYKHFLNIGWYGLSMYFIIWGSLVNIYLIIELYLNKILRLWILKIAFFILVFYLLIFQNVYWCNFTRPAIIATGTSILLFASLILNEEKTGRKYLFAKIFSVFIFALGYFTRMDGGYLSFAFCFIIIFAMIIGQKNPLKKLFKIALPFISIFILMEGYNQLTLNKRNGEFLEKIMTIKEYDGYSNSQKYSPVDKKDSLAYFAATQSYYLTDEKVITVDFLKKIAGPKVTLGNINFEKLKQTLDAFFEGLKTDSYPLFQITLFLIFIVLLNLFFNKDKRTLINTLKYIGIQFVFCFFIMVIIIKMKLPARIYNPFLIINVIGCFIVMMEFNLFNKNKLFKWILGFVFFLSCLFLPQYVKAVNAVIKNYKGYGRINHAMMDDMNRNFKNTIFIPTNVRSWEVHNATNPISEINFYNNNKYVYMSIELSVTPETQDQLIDKFGTNDHGKLFKKISEMDNVVFISTDNYNNFLRSYYHNFYNQDYYFVKVGNEDASFYQYTGLNYYRLKKVE